ncbi:MAG: hypothetical protein O2877_02205 [bacterium]|nr:hypothetical protein [bacterium]
MAKTLLKAIKYNETRSEDHVRILAALTILEQQGGYCFGVIDLRGIDGNVEPLMNLFIEQIDRAAQTITPDSNLQHRFEQIVQGMNEKIADAAEYENWDFKPEEVNALLGIAGNDELYLTGLGDLTALFLHRDKQQRYKVFNLFRGLQTENHIPDWKKLFTVVLDGELHPGDVFLVGNKEIPQHIEADELHQILVSLPPLSASEKIRQYFPIPVDLGLLAVRGEEAEDLEAMNLSNAESSLNHLSRTADTTSRLLEHQRPRKQDWATAAKNTSRTLISILVSSFNVLLAILMGFVKDIITVGKYITSAEKRRSLKDFRVKAQQGISRGKDSVLSARSHMKRLPLNNKRILIIIGAVILVFALSLLFLSSKKNKQREEAVYKTAVQEIERTYDTASASIIYKDEDQARSLLLEGIALIDSLPQNTDEQKNKSTELRAQFNESMNVLRHFTEVTELELLASLPDGEEAVALGFDDETSYGFTRNGSVFKYKEEQSTFEKVNVNAPEGFGIPARVRYDDLNDLFYLFDGRQIARMDPDQEIYELVSITDMNRTAVDMEYFARRVYILSNEDEQIYRHDSSGSGFGGPNGWIQARTIPLNDALSFSIDASVWIVKRDGKIIRYQKGFEESWPNPTIDPPLTDSTVLWTTDNTDYLYLIDTNERRIVQINKESGALRQQLSHDAFGSLQGMWEKDNTIYVLTKSGLHKFSN